jgi:hypothetical protein
MTPISLTCPVLTGGAFPPIPTMSHTITVRPRKRRLGGEQRRALRLLACSPFGVTEAVMHVHGFTRSMLAKLVRAGLGTVQRETGKEIAVGRIRITDAGRRWLEDAAKSELRGPNRFKDFWRE